MPLTVSWIRAYHTRRLDRAGDVIGRLEAAGVVTPADDLTIGFFDISALRSSHFASGTGPQLTLRLTEDDEPLVVHSHLLAHASGFIVARITASSVDNPALAEMGPSRLAELERLPWTPRQVQWTIGEVDFEAGCARRSTCCSSPRTRSWSAATTTSGR